MQNIESAQTDHNLTKVFKIDEARINNHLGEMVRSTVEQTLNDMLNAEADQLCNAKRYDRSDARTNGRAGIEFDQRYLLSPRSGRRRIAPDEI